MEIDFLFVSFTFFFVSVLSIFLHTHIFKHYHIQINHYINQKGA